MLKMLKACSKPYPLATITTNSSTLLLPGIGEDGGGVYTCSATNIIGSAESSSIEITVIPPFYGKSLVVHGITNIDDLCFIH